MTITPIENYSKFHLLIHIFIDIQPALNQKNFQPLSEKILPIYISILTSFPYGEFPEWHSKLMRFLKGLMIAIIIILMGFIHEF